MSPDDFGAALESVVGRTGVGRYRHLCSEANALPAPNSPADWRAWVLREYRGDAHPAEYPSLAAQAGSALAAAGRVAAALIRGEPVRVAPEVLEERRAICAACPHHDAARDRCRKCGCGGLKLELATERCPEGRWEAAALDAGGPAR
jgi:hypothetical protein